MGFPRQEYWSGLPFPSPGDLPDPGIEPSSLALAGEFFTTELPVMPFTSYILETLAEKLFWFFTSYLLLVHSGPSVTVLSPNVAVPRKVLFFLACFLGMLSRFSRVPFFVTPWTAAHQAPLSMGFPRQEYWSGLQFPFGGDLPDPGIEPSSPAMEGGFFPTEPPGKPPLPHVL